MKRKFIFLLILSAIIINNNSYSDNDELYIFESEKYHDLQFYKDNEKNEKMKIFYQ